MCREVLWLDNIRKVTSFSPHHPKYNITTEKYGGGSIMARGCFPQQKQERWSEMTGTNLAENM